MPAPGAAREQCSLREDDLTYLPSPRGACRKSLARMRGRLTYGIWQRILARHGGWARECEQSLSILDVGCGPGILLSCLERWYERALLVGLDVGSALLKYARCEVRSARLVQASAEILPFRSGSFDAVFALHVIEHLTSPESFPSEAKRILRANGSLLVATPNPQGTAARLLGKRWQGFRPDHISLRGPDSWHAALRQAGFAVIADGTTLFNGLPVFGRFPLGLPFLILQYLFGWFSWSLGESYMAVARSRPT